MMLISFWPTAVFITLLALIGGGWILRWAMERKVEKDDSDNLNYNQYMVIKTMTWSRSESKTKPAYSIRVDEYCAGKHTISWYLGLEVRADTLARLGLIDGQGARYSVDLRRATWKDAARSSVFPRREYWYQFIVYYLSDAYRYSNKNEAIAAARLMTLIDPINEPLLTRSAEIVYGSNPLAEGPAAPGLKAGTVKTEADELYELGQKLINEGVPVELPPDTMSFDELMKIQVQNGQEEIQ